MAEVRVATDLLLERPVVVKLLAPDAVRYRFEREAQAVAALSHPNIVQLFDYGEEEGRPYMVFEYLPGGSLEQRLDAALRLPDEDTARIAAEIAAGLAHAHARGVVHRDMKPGNVLFDVRGASKDRGFWDRPYWGHRHDYEGRNGPRYGGIHLARAGAGGVDHSGERRLFIRRAVVQDALGSAPL
jgi:serine/threonine protein kinase